MGATRERRRAGRAIRRQRRAREAVRAVAASLGIDLYDWQIDVMIAHDEARRRGMTFVYVHGRKSGRMVMRKVAGEAGL